MTSPVVFKHTLGIGLLSMAHAIALPVVAVLALVVERWCFGGPFDAHFTILLILVLTLGVVLLQPPRGSMAIIGGRAALMTRIALRWLILLFVLLMLGYATKSSSE